MKRLIVFMAAIFAFAATAIGFFSALLGGTASPDVAGPMAKTTFLQHFQPKYLIQALGTVLSGMLVPKTQITYDTITRTTPAPDRHGLMGGFLQFGATVVGGLLTFKWASTLFRRKVDDGTYQTQQHRVANIAAAAFTGLITAAFGLLGLSSLLDNGTRRTQHRRDHADATSVRPILCEDVDIKAREDQDPVAHFGQTAHRTSTAAA